jgi:N-acetyl-anhydromuramyl-L-alanine amidase AmpD
MLMVAVRRFIIPMMKIFSIQIENIHPHRKFAPYKSCPGKQFPWVDFIHMIADQINPSDARTA